MGWQAGRLFWGSHPARVKVPRELWAQGQPTLHPCTLVTVTCDCKRETWRVPGSGGDPAEPSPRNCAPPPLRTHTKERRAPNRTGTGRQRGREPCCLTPMPIVALHIHGAYERACFPQVRAGLLLALPGLGSGRSGGEGGTGLPGSKEGVRARVASDRPRPLLPGTACPHDTPGMAVLRQRADRGTPPGAFRHTPSPPPLGAQPRPVSPAASRPLPHTLVSTSGAPALARPLPHIFRTQTGSQNSCIP